MSSNSRTLIEIQDLTTTQMTVFADGRIHVLIGSEDEHQVEIVGSVRTMASLAASLVDLMPDRVLELERNLEMTNRELKKWTTSG